MLWNIIHKQYIKNSHCNDLSRVFPNQFSFRFNWLIFASNFCGQLFGFPRHYTDVGNLSRRDRHRLLGKAWSVQVTCHLLETLRDFSVGTLAPAALETLRDFSVGTLAPSALETEGRWVIVQLTSMTVFDKNIVFTSRLLSEACNCNGQKCTIGMLWKGKLKIIKSEKLSLQEILRLFVNKEKLWVSKRDTCKEIHERFGYKWSCTREQMEPYEY